MCREVANLQSLANAGGSVPRVLDHNTGRFEDPKVELYVVMDLIRGSTLTEYVESNNPMAIDTAIEFTLSLCKTIQVAHTFPILHRDLKPDNIIVRDPAEFDLVVVDYGLSFNISDEDITAPDETFRNRFLDLPETNTPSGDRRDPRSDLTALCGILYFCLSGAVPGQLQDGSGTLPHMRRGFSLRENHDDDRVTGLEEFLNRGFAPILANRYQTVEELSERLRDFLHSDTSVDESDPIQLAASLSLKLRAEDRTTQIAEFREQAQVLFNHISLEVNKYDNTLGRFQLSDQLAFFGGGGFGGGGFIGEGLGVGMFDGGAHHEYAIPDGLDLVGFSTMAFVLQAAHHDHQRHRSYAIASRGEQCVLLAADYTVKNQQLQDMTQVKLSWQEVVWYEGNPEPVFNLVSVNYRDWLTAQLKELAQEILAH